MKLTSTNRSIDLIVPITNAHLQANIFGRLNAHAYRAFGPMSSRLAARSRAVNLTDSLSKKEYNFLGAGKHKVPDAQSRWRCAGAPHQRRRPVGLAKLCELRIPFPCKTIKGKENGAQHRKRDRASGLVARPVRSARKGRSCVRTENPPVSANKKRRSSTNTSFSNLLFADLVVMAGWLHPFPSRTRP